MDNRWTQLKDWLMRQIDIGKQASDDRCELAATLRRMQEIDREHFTEKLYDERFDGED